MTYRGSCVRLCKLDTQSLPWPLHGNAAISDYRTQLTEILYRHVVDVGVGVSTVNKQ